MNIDDFHAKQPEKGNSIKDVRNKEIETLKYELKRSRMVCKAIWEHKEYIDEIKHYIRDDNLTGASELWDEVGDCYGYEVQRLLNTAPLYGGAFTTEERKIIRGFWKISTDDIEGKNNVS